MNKILIVLFLVFFTMIAWRNREIKPRMFVAHMQNHIPATKEHYQIIKVVYASDLDKALKRFDKYLRSNPGYKDVPTEKEEIDCFEITEDQILK